MPCYKWDMGSAKYWFWETLYFIWAAWVTTKSSHLLGSHCMLCIFLEILTLNCSVGWIIFSSFYRGHWYSQKWSDFLKITISNHLSPHLKLSLSYFKIHAFNQYMVCCLYYLTFFLWISYKILQPFSFFLSIKSVFLLWKDLTEYSFSRK